MQVTEVTFPLTLICCFCEIQIEIEIYLGVVYVIHSMPINNITTLNFILNVIFIHFVFFSLLFFQCISVLVCGSVCSSGSARMHRRSEEEKEKKKTQTHDNRNTIPIKQRISGWNSMSMLTAGCSICVFCIVCRLDERIYTTALTTFGFMESENILESIYLVNRIRNAMRCIFRKRNKLKF